MTYDTSSTPTDRFDIARNQTQEALTHVIAELQAKREERQRINDRIRQLVEQEEVLRSAVRVLTKRTATTSEDDRP